jgi:uncharacterized protein (TIGR03435 family)
MLHRTTVLTALLAAASFAATAVAQTSTIEITEPEAKAQPSVPGAKVNKPKVRVGEHAPPLVVEQLVGVPDGVNAAHDLSWDSLKGNVVVLEFWATWCGPCMATMPHLNRLTDEFRDKPVRFLAITDQTDTVIADFLKKGESPIRPRIALDTDRSVFDAFGVRGIPRTILVDQSGTILGIMSPEDLTAEVLEQVIAGERPRLPDGNEHGVEVTDEGGSASQAAPVVRILLRPNPTAKMGGVQHRKAGLEAEGVGLAGLIGLAWPEYTQGRIILPEDLPKGPFDLAIALPPGREDDVLPVLRQTLQWGFGITAHAERREVDLSILSIPKRGPGLTRSAEDGRSMATTAPGLFKFSHMSGSNVVEIVEGFLGTPVVDRTGLARGEFDLEFTFDPSKPESEREAFLAATGIVVTKDRGLRDVLVVERKAGAPAALAR